MRPIATHAGLGRLIAALAFLCAFILLPRPGITDDGDGKLLKIVALSRHGVRAPTQSDKTLELWSRKPWPRWPVARGLLTPRGYELARAMWSDMRAMFTDAGLWPEGACPPAGAVFVRSDVDERDQATSSAILEGLGGGCGLGYAVSRDKIDPLFHPVKAGLYRFDPIPAAMDVLNQTMGGLEKLQEELSGPMNLLSAISGPPAPNLCTHFNLPPACALADIPNAVSVSPEGSSVRLVGALDIASSIAEIFLLEYGNWPDTPAGWGQVDSRTLSQIMPLHSRIFDVVNRAPTVAWARGSSLLIEMTQALTGSHYDARANDARLVVFVGHDTNIANLGRLLGISWQVNGYPRNGIPPASALMLELWERNGKKEVRCRFFAQPPQALHAPFYPDARQAGPAHAPIAGIVSAPPVVGQARFDLAGFEAMVERATAGAPLAPQQRTETVPASVRAVPR